MICKEVATGSLRVESARTIRHLQGVGLESLIQQSSWASFQTNASAANLSTSTSLMQQDLIWMAIAKIAISSAPSSPALTTRCVSLMMEEIWKRSAPSLRLKLCPKNRKLLAAGPDVSSTANLTSSSPRTVTSSPFRLSL